MPAVVFYTERRDAEEEMVFPMLALSAVAYAPSSTSVFGFLYVLPFGAGASVPFRISIY